MFILLASMVVCIDELFWPVPGTLPTAAAVIDQVVFCWGAVQQLTFNPPILTREPRYCNRQPSMRAVDGESPVTFS